MAHPIVHVELSANNPESDSQFYRDVFGWKLESVPQFDYIMFDAEGGPGGGFVRTGEQGYKPGEVIVYIGTDSIEDSLAAIEARGGKTVMPKQEIPGMGWFAMFTDPSGNKLALYKSMNPPGGQSSQ